MAQSHRGQFGPGSLLALLALPAVPAAAEPLPPLRVNPALLGAGTPPPVSPVPEPAVVAKPVAPAPLVTEAPPPARVDPVAEPSRAVAAPPPSPASQATRGAPPAKATAPAVAGTKAGPALSPQAPVPAPLPQAAATEAPRRPPEPKKEPLPPVETIGKAQEPPEVAEPRKLPPLYSAHVAAGEMPDPSLKPTPAILPWIARPEEHLPTFVAADQIAGTTDVEIVAEGNVELRKRNSILQSDRLTYRQATEEVEAEGNVRLSRDGDRVQGPRMRMQMEESTGFFEQPEYSIRRIKTGSAPTLWTGTEERQSTDLTTGQGKAEHMDFEGEGQYRLKNATYSTCAPAAGRDPDWFVRTADLHLDYDAEEATARNATLVFQGVPIFYSPWLNFSLNNER
ncbi:MAG: hypothetical protein FIA96_16975 [Betaproteobacteria bacterium]|nr:hypothetical protein [Betaproteobacteria bacterium]